MNGLFYYTRRYWPGICIFVILILIWVHIPKHLLDTTGSNVKGATKTSGNGPIKNEKPDNTQNHYVKPSKNIKLIYYATGFFGQEWPEKYHTLRYCHIKACDITRKRKEADVIIYHGGDLPTFNSNELKRLRQTESKLWVIFNKEPPHMFLSLSYLKKFNNLFNWTASYKRSADLYTAHGIAVKLKKLQISATELKRYVGYHKRDKFAVMVTSNCFSKSDKTEKWSLVKSLKKEGIPIEVFGKCTKLYYEGQLKDLGKKGYKFYMSIQNSRCEDYHTEKVWVAAYESGLIPVIIGGRNRSNLEQDLPPKSFIHIHDFTTVNDLAVYLKKVNGSQVLFESYFQWKIYWRTFSSSGGGHAMKKTDSKNTNSVDNWYSKNYIKQNNKLIYPGRELDLVCQLCKAMYDPKKMNQQKKVNNLETDWSYARTCNATMLSL